MNNVIKVIFKPLHDILSTLYDGDGCMSLPRLFCFASFCMFVAAWFMEQYMRLSFEHFTELAGIYGVAMGSYVGKKFSEKGK